MTNRVHVATFLVALALTTFAPAQTFTTLYNFTGGSDGSEPWAGVIQDPAGNLYATTSFGGDLNCDHPWGCGVVYEVSTAGAETVLHSFSGSDGEKPGTPVARDKAGNIYGTTSYGGSFSDGAVFKIDTAGSETVLYTFTGGSDGCHPDQGLVMDKAGSLYGTTVGCGSSDQGTVFKVDSAGNFTLLHSFVGQPSDGGAPAWGHLTMDRSSNLYGVTSGGGAYGNGALYRLSKSGTLTLLYSFKGGTDGCDPLGSVLQDKAGNLYGTANYCGSTGNGAIWKVNQKGKEITLHSFAGGTSDGCNPYAGVARDSKGNLYGVTSACGANAYWGALYELSARGKLTLLHSFDWSDGATPFAEVLRTTEGTLFGTTWQGGADGFGTVWKYVP